MELISRNSKIPLYYQLYEILLSRIKDGTYGKCHSCGKAITKARLTAVPHARFCIACKEEEEKKKARRK